jgi:hypothetical protein
LAGFFTAFFTGFFAAFFFAGMLTPPFIPDLTGRVVQRDVRSEICA